MLDWLPCEQGSKDGMKGFLPKLPSYPRICIFLLGAIGPLEERSPVY